MNKSRTKTWIVLLSPIFILLIGNLAARLFRGLLGNWAWAGYFPVYWSLLFVFMYFTGKREHQHFWFQKSQGNRWWILLAIGIGLISFPVLLIPNINVLNSVTLVFIWCCFAVINSAFEETYWRGFLLDETTHFPRAFGVTYSTVLFTLIHPINLGVFSKIQAYDPSRPMSLISFLFILVILSLLWSLLYLKTKSLRLSILSHILTDMGNLSIFLFMNMVNM
jgi:membrane protease YdiL (CAAX protease family)